MDDRTRTGQTFIDDDIDFDFDLDLDADDAQDDAPGRGRGFGRKSGPYKPKRSRRAPNWSRIAIALAVLAVILIVLVVTVRAIINNRREASYREYVSEVTTQVATPSSAQGAELSQLFSQPAGEVDRAELVQDVTTLAARANTLVAKAEAIEPPEAAIETHGWLITTLQYRANGLAAVQAALVQALKDNDDAAAAQAIVEANWRLIASDVVWEDSYVHGVGEVLKRENISPGDVMGNDEGKSDGVDNLPEFSAAGMFVTGTPEVRLEFASLNNVNLQLARLKGGKTAGGAGKDGKPAKPKDGKLHGTQLGDVTMAPSGLTLAEGSLIEVQGSAELAFDVTVVNSGEGQEVDIPITVELTSDVSEPRTYEATLASIDPGESQVVSVPVDEAPSFGNNYRAVVKIGAVPGEEMLSNNTKTFEVRFQM